ncbi:flagellar hook capping FlgD N-terminal domain-containing protein [Ferrimonas balearica]|uniref:flagellar hook capping FlgD N-terminal domain-containing protein n=1 Tax=Ferrimonas balearica TaxID=44012 RepID=UPI001C999D01|nr:flagellar hook capping FlgD N-terminal domain-containing protein [Ferrimonas balearica]MBY5991980.1 flagellar biosynthesis protein FlgD [Ferrimonas balearica]
MNPIALDGAQPTTSNEPVAQNGGTNPNDPFALKNEFLTLMVAQIQNQDPLNPLDGTEYVTQLAQFSQVESLEYLRMGQQNQAILMENLQVLGTTNLIGREVLVDADSIELGTEAVNGKIYLENAVESLTLEVTDENGNVVATLEKGSQGEGEVDFVLDPEELGLPPGEYQLTAKTEAGGESGEALTMVAATVNKVHINSATGYMMLELGNGLGAVSIFDIREMA